MDRPTLARVVARILFAVLLYLCLGTLVFFVNFVLLRGGVPTGLPGLQEVQKNLYHGGLRNIWQNQPGYAVFDEKLIYRPKDGACSFRNAELDTVLNFVGGMRAQKQLSGDRAGIAVIGDSHARGWGCQRRRDLLSHCSSASAGRSTTSASRAMARGGNCWRSNCPGS